MLGRARDVKVRKREAAGLATIAVTADAVLLHGLRGGFRVRRRSASPRLRRLRGQAPRTQPCGDRGGEQFFHFPLSVFGSIAVSIAVSARQIVINCRAWGHTEPPARQPRWGGAPSRGHAKAEARCQRKLALGVGPARLKSACGHAEPRTCESEARH